MNIRINTKMRKFSKGLVLSMVLVGLLVLPVGPATAQAQTDEITIESLLAQIESLKTQILELQQRQSQLQVANKELRLNLLRFLQEGATGEDVKRLQEYLALDSDIYPEGLITGYFGPLTASAVRKFQRKHGIDQVGVVGPITRGKLHKLFGEGFLPDGSVPPGLTHAPGILKKVGGICAVPGIAKKLSSCDGAGVDTDDDEDNGDEDDGDENVLEFNGVVRTLSDDELVLEDDSVFVINDDTEIEDGVEVGSEVDVKYEVDGDDFVALEIKLDDGSDDDEEEEDDEDEEEDDDEEEDEEENDNDEEDED